MGLQALLMKNVTSRSLEVLDLSDNPLVTNQGMDFNPTVSFPQQIPCGLVQRTACNLEVACHARSSTNGASKG